MDGAVIVWIVTAVVLGIIEGVTVSLVSIWMAAGALAASVTAALGGSIILQVMVFSLVSAVLLILTAPLSKKFRTQKKTETNADRLIGQEGVVIKSIDPIENKGQIKVMGQIWSASDSSGKTIDVGEKVIVEKIEGAHVLVRHS